jgi:hypothetical protein
MVITTDRVTLARIDAVGDHAVVDTLELSPQYP